MGVECIFMYLFGGPPNNLKKIQITSIKNGNERFRVNHFSLMNCIHNQVEILKISGNFGKDFQAIFVLKKYPHNKRVSENTMTRVSIYFIESINMLSFTFLEKEVVYFNKI